VLAHKIELRPAAGQAEYLDKASGPQRRGDNLLLGHFSESGKKPRLPKDVKGGFAPREKPKFKVMGQMRAEN
jgi:hypothetical protein